MRYIRFMPSPVGRLTLVADETGLIAVSWAGIDRFLDNAIPDGDHPVLDEAARQLDEYFAGRRQTFDLPISTIGTTFQREVWAGLMMIPYGQTRSYGEIAGQLGRPGAARAVGAANRCNPVCIVVPCHRVIGVNGTLTGFIGGVDVKARLLALEAKAA